MVATLTPQVEDDIVDVAVAPIPMEAETLTQAAMEGIVGVAEEAVEPDALTPTEGPAPIRVGEAGIAVAPQGAPTRIAAPVPIRAGTVAADSPPLASIEYCAPYHSGWGRCLLVEHP